MPIFCYNIKRFQVAMIMQIWGGGDLFTAFPPPEQQWSLCPFFCYNRKRFQAAMIMQMFGDFISLQIQCPVVEVNTGNATVGMSTVPEHGARLCLSEKLRNLWFKWYFMD